MTNFVHMQHDLPWVPRETLVNVTLLTSHMIIPLECDSCILQLHFGKVNMVLLDVAQFLIHHTKFSLAD